MYKARLLLHERIEFIFKDVDALIRRETIGKVVFPENLEEKNSYKVEAVCTQLPDGDEEWNELLEKKVEITSESYFEVALVRERTESGNGELKKFTEVVCIAKSTAEENPEYVAFNELEAGECKFREAEKENGLEEKKGEDQIQRPNLGVIMGGKFKS